MGSIEAVMNLNDGSVYISPGLEYNLAENIYISAGAFLGFGKSIEKRTINFQGTSITGPFPESEFGSYPHNYYSSFRIYF